MGDRRRRGGICILSVVVLLAAVGAAAEEANVKSLSVGLAYDHFSRSVVWSGDEAASKILSHRISARADIAMESGLVLAFTAGFSLSRFPALTFDGLPVSLQFDGASVGGFAIGAMYASSTMLLHVNQSRPSCLLEQPLVPLMHTHMLTHVRLLLTVS